MLVTEQEAASKWCPFTDVQIFSVTARVALSARNMTDGVNCIGTRCMAWRETENAAGAKVFGFCGLAGLPVIAQP
jgi:hypothetical protein